MDEKLYKRIKDELAPYTREGAFEVLSELVVELLNLPGFEQKRILDDEFTAENPPEKGQLCEATDYKAGWPDCPIVCRFHKIGSKGNLLLKRSTDSADMTWVHTRPYYGLHMVKHDGSDKLNPVVEDGRLLILRASGSLRAYPSWDEYNKGVEVESYLPIDSQGNFDPNRINR